jgi:hypothetical protein
MYRRTARGNRIGLAISGLLLLAGGLALAAGYRGLYGTASRNSPLYPDAARTFIRENHGWLWPAAAAGAIVIGLVFLRWLLLQARTDRLRRIIIDTDDGAASQALTDTGAGRTDMPAAVITDTVEDDTTTARGVRRATAALSGYPDAPQLWLAVTTDADADLGRVCRHITGKVIPAARTAIETPDMPTYLRLTVSRRAGGGSNAANPVGRGGAHPPDDRVKAPANADAGTPARTPAGGA